MERTFRPIELGRAMGISAATVRMYEREGFLPPAERNPAGHRQYRYHHVRALETARALMRGYGWEYAKQVMRAFHAGQFEEVTDLVDARHAAIDRERRQLAEMVQVIDALSGVEGRAHDLVLPVGMTQPVRVGEAARLTGVPVSTVHFWEEQELLSPERDPESNYRVYTADDVRQLRMIVMLRDAGYRFEAIRSVLDEFGRGNPASAYAAIRQREQELQRASMDCMAATSALWRFIDECKT